MLCYYIYKYGFVDLDFCVFSESDDVYERRKVHVGHEKNIMIAVAVFHSNEGNWFAHLNVCEEIVW